jgi:hypothetical protein
VPAAADYARRRRGASPIEAAPLHPRNSAALLSLLQRRAGVPCNFFASAGSIASNASDMKCEELLKALNDYVDGQIDPALCAEFEQHLRGCNPCQIVVDNIRQTITLYKAGQPYELPLEFRRRLHEALRAAWRKKFGTEVPGQ